jgi:hypothetical protein
MILFFGTRDHVDTVNQFADSWAPELRTHIRTLPYENIEFRRPLPGSLCIFMDFERLLPLEMALARRLASALRAFPKKYTVLNEPARYLGRLRLLEVLHQRGINEFRACQPGTLADDLKYPVFLRSEIDHEGPATALLHSAGELQQALARKEFQDLGLRPHLMVTEFCDCTEADGLFRKYSVMNIGGTLIPRHVLFSRNWVTKRPDFVDAGTVAEEAKFIGNFPHATQVAEIFKLAAVEYGRMDYGLHNGRVQVWEINTNPTVVPKREKVNPLRLASQSASAGRIAAVLKSFSNGRDSAPAFPFRSAKMLPAKILQIISRRAHRRHRK